MDEEQSYLPLKEEEPMFHFISQPTNHKKSEHHLLFEQNIIPPLTHQMFGFQTPSPFQKEIIVNIKEESEEEKEDFIKQQKQVGQNGISGINFRDSSQSESKEGDILNRRSMNRKQREGRNTEKGLKKLSKQVYEIIVELKTATYKQIAGQLLQTFHQKQKNDPLSENIDFKVEQNIKRRVYDALNVLIAAGLLKKKGKKVIYEPKVKSQQKTEVDSVCSQQNKFDLMIAEKQKAYQWKLQKCKVMQNNYEIMSQLIKRNQIKSESEKMYFPLIGINFNNEVSRPFVIRKKKSQMSFEVKKLNSLEGDLDFLNKLNFLRQENAEKTKEERKIKQKSKLIYRFQ